MAAEVQAVYGTQDYLRDAPDEHAIATNVASLRRLSSLLPEEVGLGFHFCFGTFGGWPRFEPDDLGKLVELANAAVAATGRRVDWVHIPMLDRVEDDFDAPLATLDVHGARVYLGMIHSMPNFPQRLSAARKFLPDFGVAAYCGFGRISPDRLSAIFRDHHRALELAQAAPL
ncbi:MAG: hypothetical protein ACREFD_19065 [Stellaceae bacterium]